MTEAPPIPAGQGERRLHPWSWLFVLVQQLRQFIVPLLALLVFGGRRGDGDLWVGLGPVIAVAVLVLMSIWQYFTYRYRVDGERLTVRSGLLHRTVREIPFARIHNVVVHQSLLHRLFGVAEVRLESAGGQKPEAQMRVLGLDDALALEALVRHRGQVPAGSATTAPDRRDESGTLLALPTPEVVKLGLISNRGMLVAAAGFGLVWQIFPDRLITDFIRAAGRQVLGYAGQWHLGTPALAAGIAVLALLLLAAVRLLSVLLALTQYHGFRLSEAHRRLTVERGLLARLRTSVARRRIQAWTLSEGLLHRLFDRRTLRIDTAVAEQGNDKRALKELAPIAPPAACDGLIQHLLPGIAWPPPHWQPAPRGIAWRLMLPELLLVPLATAALAWKFGAWGLLALLWWPWSALLAFQHARHLGHAIDERLVAVRGGWWSRWWRFAEIDKLQALQLQRSPLDRRCGTATLWLDTAGATGLAPPLRIRFLPEADARALYARLARTLSRRRLQW